jgi:RNA polymerase sigma factor (sigma-70 family)
MKNNYLEKVFLHIKNDEHNQYLELIYKLLIPIAKKSLEKYDYEKMIVVDDLIQDVVIVFYRKIKSDPDYKIENMEGYLFTLCRNQIIGLKNKKGIITQQLENQELIEENHFESLEVSEAKTNLLLSALEQIGESCKALIRGYYYENLSMKQLALKLNYSSEDVAKTKHYKCKAKLSKILETSSIYASH